MNRKAIRFLTFCIALTALRLPAGEVARVGSESITSAELERAASVRLLRVRTEIYEARRAAVDELVTKMLIAKAAAAAGLSPEAWLDRETANRMTDVSQEEIAAAFKTVTGEVQSMADLARNMREVRRSETREQILHELRAAAKVDIRLQPPRLEERDLGGPIVAGPDEAPVTVVAFEDFECPFSARLGPVLDALRSRYPEQLRIIHRDLPLPRHPHAKLAAEAAACANQQGGYWEMAALMYMNQRALERADLERYAVEAKLDRVKFAQCLDEGKQSFNWTEGIAAARKYDVRGTPALFINGRLLAGAREFADVAAVIEEELVRR